MKKRKSRAKCSGMINPFPSIELYAFDEICVACDKKKYGQKIELDTNHPINHPIMEQLNEIIKSSNILFCDLTLTRDGVLIIHNKKGGIWTCKNPKQKTRVMAVRNAYIYVNYISITETENVVCFSPKEGRYCECCGQEID